MDANIKDEINSYDYCDSDLLVFSYDVKERKLLMIVDYNELVIRNSLSKNRGKPLSPEQHSFIFSGIQEYSREGVLPLVKHKENNYFFKEATGEAIILLESMSITYETKDTTSLIKVELNFFNPFGKAKISCSKILFNKEK